MDRLSIKITGESGSGLLSTGEIITKAFNRLGFYVVADREYPSLIKGGHSCFLINISSKPVRALSKKVDIMMCMDKQSMEAYYGDLRDGGVMIHGYERPLGVKEMVAELEGRGVKVIHQMAREIAEECGGNVLMTNMVLIGMLWKTLGLDYSFVEAEVTEKFKDKPKLLAIDLKCLEAGYEKVETETEMRISGKTESAKGNVLIDGARALVLGAIHGGTRAYYAYPMSPASTMLGHFADLANDTGVLVKQVEDEISVAQMVLGSMYMGTRAICGTSGGGFDLMTETVSVAGIIENPWVCVVAQRPGPGTGLPTWTMQGDLNLAIYSGHGEYAKAVIGVSDPTDAFDLIQHALNLAEVYQMPVIVLTEKTIAETIISTTPFEQFKIPIERGLVEGGDLAKLKNTDRYEITETGLSKRWIPGSSEAYYFANGDEHKEDGSLEEDTPATAHMYAKRVRKLELIEKNLPDPEVLGEANADISFIGWGSSKNVMRDVIEIYKARGVKVNYLHVSYLFPLKTGVIEKFFQENKNVNLIEGNYTGQLGNLIEEKLQKRFSDRLLKFDGRAFFVEDVMEFVDASLRRSAAEIDSTSCLVDSKLKK